MQLHAEAWVLQRGENIQNVRLKAAEEKEKQHLLLHVVNQEHGQLGACCLQEHGTQVHDLSSCLPAPPSLCLPACLSLSLSPFH